MISSISLLMCQRPPYSLLIIQLQTGSNIEKLVSKTTIIEVKLQQLRHPKVEPTVVLQGSRAGVHERSEIRLLQHQHKQYRNISV